MAQAWGQTPTGTNVGNSADFPGTKQGAPPSRWPDDHGHKGSVDDRMSIGNAHPHQSHSTGYTSAAGTKYDNHGFEAVHIVHAARDVGGMHVRGS